VIDIDFGQNFVAEIEQGLREADLAFLFLSPEAARSVRRTGALLR
jgi:hypothetical protein